MSFIYNLADTWNAIGTTFNSILMNVSNGAGGAPIGAAASRILNLQKNGATIFQVDVDGNTGVGAGITDFTSAGVNAAFAVAGVVNLGDGNALAWGGGTGRASITGNKTTGSMVINAGNVSGALLALQTGSGGGAATRLSIDDDGNVVIGAASIATTAVDGFFYIETCAGPPTGVPTAFTGRVPVAYDSVNNQLYIYNGGWKQPKTPAGAAIVTWQ